MGEENQTKQTKPKINQTEPSKQPHGLSCFCELSLNSKFQFPRLCESYISTQNSSFGRKKISAKKNSGKIIPSNIFLTNFFVEFSFAKFCLAKILF